jgi:hypothetical protein
MSLLDVQARGHLNRHNVLLFFSRWRVLYMVEDVVELV